MMNEHEYYCFLKEFWKVTNDGFIIVDPNGVRCWIKRHDFFPDPHKGDQMTFLDSRLEQSVLF